MLVLTHETQRLEAATSLMDFHPRRMFFEKPLVAKNGQAEVCEEDFFAAKNLLKRMKSENTETAMIFNYRFFEQTRRLREWVVSKPLGKLLQATLFVNYACWSHCIDLLQYFGGRARAVMLCQVMQNMATGNRARTLPPPLNWKTAQPAPYSARPLPASWPDSIPAL